MLAVDRTPALQGPYLSKYLTKEYYLHYNAENAQEEIAELKSIIQEKKDAIMFRHIQTMGERKRKVAEKAQGISQKTASLVEAVLSGDIFTKPLEYSTNNPSLIVQSDNTGRVFSSVKHASVVIKENLKNVQSYSDFVEAINNTVFSFLKANGQEMIDDYTQAILDELIEKGKTTMIYRNLSGKMFGKKILNSILSRREGTLFKKVANNHKGENLNVGIVRLIALIAVLPIPEGYTPKVRLNSSIRLEDIDENIVMEAISGLFAGWLRNINRSLSEVVDAMNFIKTTGYAAQNIKNLGINIEKDLSVVGNGGSVIASMEMDPALSKFLEDVGIAEEELEHISKSYSTRGNLKKDVNWRIGEDGAYIEVGFNVKATNLVITPDMDHIYIRNLQKGTSLFNAIFREAEIPSNQLKNIFQLVSAHGDSGFNLLWEELKTTIAYRGFLNLIAGFGDEYGDSSYFMIIGDKIWKMEDIIGHIMGNIGTTSLKMIETKRDELSRNRFVNMNIYSGEQNSWAQASLRTEGLYKILTRAFYSTKVDFTLKMGNIAALLKTAL